MTELELLQQISDNQIQQNTLLAQIIDSIPNMSLLTGLTIGVLIGFMFWNIIKGGTED